MSEKIYKPLYILEDISSCRGLKQAMSLLKKLKNTPLQLLAHSAIAGALIFSGGCEPFDKSKHKDDVSSGSSAPATAKSDPEDSNTEQTPAINHYPFLERQDKVQDFNPVYQNLEFIANSDWQKYVKPLLSQPVSDEIAAFEATVKSDEQIFARAVSAGDALYIINTPSQPATGTNYSDDYGADGIPEYFGKKKFTQGTMGELENILVTTLAKNSAIERVAATAGENTAISYNNQLDLPGQGAVTFDVIFEYKISGQGITAGVLYNSAEEPADPTALQKIEAFNAAFRNQGTYLPVSALVMQKQTRCKIEKNMDDEFDYHTKNNP